jgi:RNA polymerase sigma-70 factor (ECF subfamily)
MKPFLGRHDQNDAANRTLKKDSHDNYRDFVASLVRELQPSLLGFFQSGGFSNAEDLSQETWLAVVKALPKFKGDRDALRRFVFSIAYRKRADAYRRSYRNREQLTDPAAPVISSVAERKEPRDFDASVTKMLSQLPEPQSVAISLRILSGLSVSEAAKIMGIPEGTFRSLTHRGLKKLGELLANNRQTYHSEGEQRQ